MVDHSIVDGENKSKGEFEIEKIPTHTVEARSRYLVPAVDHLQGPKVQMPRVPALVSSNHPTGFYEHGKPSSNDPIYSLTDADVGVETGEEDTNGFVNSDSSPVSDTRLETVDNRESSLSETQSELVNNSIDQKLKNHEVDEFG